jgi:Variant SH3 domain
MSLRQDVLVRVISDYQAPFPDPIRVKAGEKVTVDLGKTTNIPGWVWCTSRAGKSGWVPKDYLELRDTKGLMKCDYDAIELTVHVGELLSAHKLESHFYWVTNEHGRHGWVPVEHVEPVQAGKEVEK